MPNEQPELTQQTAGMKVLDKKLEGYYSKHHDFMAANELTITITLAEYRELVGSAAKSSLELEKRDREITKLRQDLESTKADLGRVRELIAIKQPDTNEDSENVQET